MAFMDDALVIMRRKSQQGKRMVYVHSDPEFFANNRDIDRTNLRYVVRVNVAFLTEREYRAWKKRQR